MIFFLQVKLRKTNECLLQITDFLLQVAHTNYLRKLLPLRFPYHVRNIKDGDCKYYFLNIYVLILCYIWILVWERIAEKSVVCVVGWCESKSDYCDEIQSHCNLAYGMPMASCSSNSCIKSCRIMLSVVPNFTGQLFPIRCLDMTRWLCLNQSWSLWLARVLVLILDLFSEQRDGFLGRWRHFVGLCCFLQCLWIELSLKCR